MLFSSCNGKTFNSISFAHYEARMGLSAREYAMCVGDADDLYIVLGDEDLAKCKQRANKFVKRFKASVSIWYFERESDSNLIKKFICYIDPPYKSHKKKSRYDNSDNPNVIIHDKTSNPDIVLDNTYAEKYLESLSKSKDC